MDLQKGVRVFFDGGAHAQCYRCVIWSLEHEVALREFSYHTILHEVVHKFGQYASDPAHDRGYTKFQGLHQRIHIEGRGPVGGTHENTTIPLLYEV